jgi:hypothetical protein
MTTYTQHITALPTSFLDNRELLTSTPDPLGRFTTDGDFVVFLLEAINDAIFGNHLEAFDVSYIATRDTSPEPSHRFHYNVDLVATATSFERPDELPTTDADGIGMSWGPSVLGWKCFTTVGDLEAYLRDVLRTVSPDHRDDRYHMWPEYYPTDQLDADGHAPCHPHYDEATVPALNPTPLSECPDYQYELACDRAQDEAH